MKMTFLFLLPGLWSVVTFGFQICVSSAVEPPPKKTSMFNERWLDAVVSVEQLAPQRQPDRSIKINPAPIGTGFIVQTKNKHLVLVTAKHVATEYAATEAADSQLQVKKDLRYRLNEKEGPAYLINDQELEKKGLGKWFLSNKHDIACRFLEWKETSKFAVITQADFLQRADLQVGAQLLVLGFPPGLRSPEHPNPVARRGMVARSDRDAVIADVFIFPGNSGGPAIYMPPIKVGGAMTSPFINEERLVGLVISYEPYQEIAESKQTKKSRIVFVENSGLAYIEPADAILELLNDEEVQKLDASIPRE